MKETIPYYPSKKMNYMKSINKQINTFLLLLLCFCVQPTVYAAHILRVKVSYEGSNGAAQVIAKGVSTKPAIEDWTNSKYNPYEDQCGGISWSHGMRDSHTSTIYLYTRIPTSSKEYGKWLFDMGYCMICPKTSVHTKHSKV